MPGTMTIIAPDGEITVVLFNKTPDLTVLQAAVGGPIEAVPGWDEHHGEPAAVFCHEEGKLEGLEYNATATRMWADAIQIDQHRLNDVLVGPIVIVTGDRRFMAAL